MLPFPNLFLYFPNVLLLGILALGILLIPLELVGFRIEGFFIVGTIAITYSGLSLLLKNGKFAYTIYARFINFSIAVLLIGILFKTMHWPAANQLLMVGMCSIPVLYTVYFFTAKKDYSILSILKLLFVFSAILVRSIMLLHWPYAFEFTIIYNVLFIGVLAIFITQNFSLLKNS